MNETQLKSLRDAITAHLNGEKVQCRSDYHGDWKDIPDPTFFASYEWRPKPKPRRWWVNIAPDGTPGYPCITKEEALLGTSIDYTVVEVEEVIKPNQKDT